MLLTIKQSGGKYCPIIKLRCQGEQCMAWRWMAPLRQHVWMPDKFCDSIQEPERPANLPASYVWIPDEGEGGIWVQPEDEAAACRTGYCGLVGKPEVSP